MTFTVSVLIDTYNHEKFIGQAIESVLGQDFPAANFEIVVVDDGSTDSTPEVVCTFEPRVTLYRKSNGGQASAFNFGLARCHGDIVIFLDGDDWMAPTRLSTIVRTLESDREIGAVGHGIYEADELGEIVATIHPDRPYRCALHDVSDVREFLPLRGFLGTSRLAIRRALLNQILPVPEEITIEADEFLFTMAAVYSTVLVVPEPLAFYRIHSNNLYQFSDADPNRIRRKQRAIAALDRELRPRLARSRLSPDAASLLVLPIHVDSERMSLSLGHGWSWQAFRAEREAAILAHSEVSFAYRLFQLTTFALCLLLPPKQYYALRRWYTTRGLGRLRARFATSSPADKSTVRVERK